MPALRRIRVLHVLEATEGGTARHLLDVLAHLPRDRYEVTAVCSPLRDPAFVRGVRAVGSTGTRIEWVNMTRAVQPLRDLAAVATLARYLRRRRYDLVHTHSSKAGALGRLAALLASPVSRRIHTPHAFSFLLPGSAMRRGVYIAAEWILARFTDRFIAVSAGERRQVRRLAPRAAVAVVYNGVDPAPFREARRHRAAVRAEFGVPTEAFLVGCVGRLTAQKGQTLLLKAVATLGSRRRKRVWVVLVGAGEDETKLQALARELGIGRQVVFAGHRAPIAPVYGALDLYCLPSFSEGCPYTLLEAMAAGLPCVATAVDGSRELVLDGTTGRLTPPGDFQTLAAVLAEASARPDRLEKWGEAGRRRVQERFTLDRMIAGLDEVYRTALAEGRRS